MANRIIRGYWDCPQCGTKGIDGLKDTCPGCGSGKDKHVRYYMKSVEEVSQEELTQAGIGAEEGDGAHREWVCAYCGYLNNYADQVCVRCGAGKEEQEGEYGGDTSSAQYTADSHGNLKETSSRPKPPSDGDHQASMAGSGRSFGGGGLGKRILLLGVIAAILAFFLWPHTTSEAITGFAWERSVQVEELQTFSESGWTLPADARQTASRMEFHGYRQVLDHYETVYETRTRRVLDHYDISYEYTDNGNGTFSEHEVRTPVYRSEDYETPVQTPIYRSEPVYQRKYYYDIDRWIPLQTYTTSGEDHTPYWSTDYTLTETQRDETRTERYVTIYSGGEHKTTSFEEWRDQDIGDGVYVTANRLGMEYSRVTTVG